MKRVSSSILMMLLVLAGCSSSVEEEYPETMAAVFACDGGISVNLAEDGSIILFVPDEEYGYDGTYTHEDKYVYKATLADGSGGYFKVKDDRFILITDSSLSIEQMNEQDFSYSCPLKTE